MVDPFWRRYPSCSAGVWCFWPDHCNALCLVLTPGSQLASDYMPEMAELKASAVFFDGSFLLAAPCQVAV